MKLTLVVIAALAAFAAHATPVEDDIVSMLEKEKALYPRFITMPDSEGNARIVDLEAPIDYELLNEIERNPRNNAYWLFTRSNPNTAQILTVGDSNSVRNSNFNANKETIFIAHGWMSTGNTDLNPVIRKAYLDKKDVNVITVDWRRLAISDYTTAALGVPAVGCGVGEFINWLESEFNLRPANLHLVGFSLGAHLVGNAGRAMNGNAARITALDPAGPLWNYNTNRIRSSDGRYVEALHTDGGYTVGGLGIGSAIVDVDFFANGGISQPGCLANLCNHNRAWELFAATVTYNHLWGNRCTTNLQVTWDTCRGALLYLGGDDLSKTGTSGSYRVNTGSRYPYNV